MIELEGVALFRGLSPQEFAEVRKVAQERRFTDPSPNRPAGESHTVRTVLPEGPARSFSTLAIIFQEGDDGDGLYVIKDGSVQIAHVQAGEIRYIFCTLKSGDVFGEMAVIEDHPRSATALAADGALLYFIPRTEMRRLLQQYPILAFNLLQMVSQRLRDLDELHLRERVQSESLALIGRFALGIVHDLKNPLSIIELCAEIFDMPNIDPEIKAQTHTRIRKQVDRISTMVSDILIYTENKRHETTLQPTQFNTFLEELLPDLKAEVELRSAVVELKGTIPDIIVKLDARRLSRVFYNLLHNAADFMPDGGTIHIRCHQTGQEIQTEVEDTGPGIAPEIADKLFQPFSTYGKTHGSGLGLSICKRIVEDHGGRIWIRNEPGRGAIFCFALPLAK
jgi:signal transduction histidine kinase